MDFGIFSMFTGAAGLITSLISAKGRRIGDVLGETTRGHAELHRPAVGHRPVGVRHVDVEVAVPVGVEVDVELRGVIRV